MHQLRPVDAPVRGYGNQEHLERTEQLYVGRDLSLQRVEVGDMMVETKSRTNPCLWFSPTWPVASANLNSDSCHDSPSLPFLASCISEYCSAECM